MGRPKEFDPDEALGAALDVFWRKGFDGASLTDLTEAMRITRPSLYAEFGNKEQLFRKALEQYQATCLAFSDRALGEATARLVAERLLFGAADAQTDGVHPAGCLATNGMVACSDAAGSIRRAVLLIRDRKHAALRERLDRARHERDLPDESDPEALAGFLEAVVQGMAVMAATGASRETLYGVVRTSLEAWPSGRRSVHPAPVSAIRDRAG